MNLESCPNSFTCFMVNLIKVMQWAVWFTVIGVTDSGMGFLVSDYFQCLYWRKWNVQAGVRERNLNTFGLYTGSTVFRLAKARGTALQSQWRSGCTEAWWVVVGVVGEKKNLGQVRSRRAMCRAATKRSGGEHLIAENQVAPSES